MRHPTASVAALVAVLAALVTGGCARRTEQETHAASAPDIAVSVVKASRRGITSGITLTGELVPFQEVEVMAKVAGYVQRILVDVGDRASQGQLLAVLEVPEMKDDMVRAAATIERNRAEVQRARDELSRAESGFNMAHLTYSRLAGVSKTQPGLVAQQEIDDAQSRDLMAGAQVAAAKSALAVAQEQIRVAQAEQSRLQTMLDYSRVTAPFAGTVTWRYANTGSMIQAGTASSTSAMPIVRLSQNSLLRLVLPVPESASGRVKTGMSVEVRIPSLKRSFPGNVARVSDKVDTATRTMRTEVDVPNLNGQLIPGMYAEVDLILADSPNAVLVPLTSIRERSGKRLIYVVSKDNKVESRDVKVGLESAIDAEVLSGISEGDLVITSNPSQLSPGQVVSPKIAESTGA